MRAAVRSLFPVVMLARQGCLPDPDMTPKDVVTTQLEALRRDDLAEYKSLTSPVYRRDGGGSEQLLARCSSFEILSMVPLSPRRWSCRVRIDGTYEYKWTLSRQAETRASFGLGQVLAHRRFGYRGVVVGIDDVCRQSDEWMRAADLLKHGRDQPFYHLCVDVRDMEPYAGPHMESPGRVVTYVAEEDLSRPPEPIKPVSHPLVYTHLNPESFRDGSYEPVAILRDYYSYPCAVEDCWLVDSVTPDGPLARRGMYGI